MLQLLERLAGRLGQALDIDAPAGQLGGQPGVLPLAADGQRELVVRHDNDCRLPFVRVIF